MKNEVNGGPDSVYRSQKWCLLILALLADISQSLLLRGVASDLQSPVRSTLTAEQWWLQGLHKSQQLHSSRNGTSKTKTQNELILILGCSIDINSIADFCHAGTGVTPESVVQSSPFSYLASCTVGWVTIAYVFHPGATPPPYFRGYHSMEASLGATTQDIVSKSKQDMLNKFGKLPSAVVVDSSLWDVSNWWDKAGHHPYPFPVPTLQIQQWCTVDLPNLLNFVQSIFPNAPVAYRSPPTVMAGDNAYGQDPAIIDAMVSCVEKHLAGSLLYNKFGFVDYHHFVDQSLVNTAASLYRDPLHPGPQLSMQYIQNILNWATGALKLLRQK